MSGVAFFDYDNDGLLDVFLTNGARMTELDKTDPVFWNRLYRNLGGFKFEDVTEKAGVKGHGYDNGVATADYDNDGWTDLFVAGLRENVLYRNKGDGTFEDATAKAGLENPDPDYGTLWAVAAAFFDYDKDGDLDLFVSNYCVWDPKTEPLLRPEGIERLLPPEQLQGPAELALPQQRRRHLHRRLEGLGHPRARSARAWASGVADFDQDGWTDVFVANDTEPNFLFRNLGNGRFEEIGFVAGVAYPESGRALSGMGADARDIDDDGRPDIFHTALSTARRCRSSGTWGTTRSSR